MQGSTVYVAPVVPLFLVTLNPTHLLPWQKSEYFCQMLLVSLLARGVVKVAKAVRISSPPTLGRVTLLEVRSCA